MAWPPGRWHSSISILLLNANSVALRDTLEGALSQWCSQSRLHQSSGQFLHTFCLKHRRISELCQSWLWC
jgi:hypothetical protein